MSSPSSPSLSGGCQLESVPEAHQSGSESDATFSGSHSRGSSLPKEDGDGNGRSRAPTYYSEDLSGYTAPKLYKQQQDLLSNHIGKLTVSCDRLRLIIEAFLDQLAIGLNVHKSNPSASWNEELCCFKMLDSFVYNLTDGSETGVFYALDFGGTNFRAVRVDLKGNGNIKTTQSKFSLKYEGPSGHNKGLLDGSSTATQLFNHFADRLKKVMAEAGDIDSTDAFRVGFTFSFPCQQLALERAKLVEWTKGFETGRVTDDPVEGEDVGGLMNQAFQRNNIPASVSAVTNDTVGTLVSCAYQKPKDTDDCVVGIILGTGTNGSYVEPRYKEYGYVGQIINVEYGNFNKELPLTEVDVEIDFNTANRGKQLFEKLVSGAYLGEVVRLFTIRILRNRAPPKSWIFESLSSEDCADIINDQTPDLSISRQILLNKWEVHMDQSDIKDLHLLCCAVFSRSAALAAAAICAMAKQSGRLDAATINNSDKNHNYDSKEAFGKQTGLTVAVDGSLYVKNPWYSRKLREYIRLLLGDDVARKVRLIPAHDGSGQGAAIIAAACSVN